MIKCTICNTDKDIHSFWITKEFVESKYSIYCSKCYLEYTDFIKTLVRVKIMYQISIDEFVMNEALE